MLTVQIITLASEGGFSGEYTHGPVVGTPTAGDTAAVTFRELQRPGSDETGPQLQLLNVTAWCGPNWQDAESIAAAALAQASSGEWTSHGTMASMGQQADASSERSAKSESRNADGRNNEEDSTSSDSEERGWKRPLAVAGGICAFLRAPRLCAMLLCSFVASCLLSCSLRCSRL